MTAVLQVTHPVDSAAARPASFGATGLRWPDRLVWYVLVGTTAAFAGLQHVLFDLQRELERARFGDVASRAFETTSVARFLAFALGSVAIVAAGRRAVFAVPTLTAVLVPLVAGSGFGLFPPGPSPLGFGWAIRVGEFSMPSTGLLWLGTVVDAGLALCPAALLAWRWRDRRSSPIASTALRAASIALCALVFVVYAHTRAQAEAAPLSTMDEVAVLIPLFALGLLVAPARHRWLWIVPALVLMTQGEVLAPFVEVGRWPHGSELRLLWPPLVAAGIGCAWPTLAKVLASAEGAPLRLAIAVNALNIADAVLTAVAIDAGEAAEANPVARVLGMPAKVVLVAAATVWLTKHRPRALIWPLLGLTAVFVWHLSGIALRSS